MKVGIMQPYFFPYIGYWQLINSVDIFVVYDEIEYTKKGWINRNKILVNESPKTITIPIKKDSDFLNVNERYISDSWFQSKHKMLNLIKSSYVKAPQFKQIMPFIAECLSTKENNLFKFLYLNLTKVIDLLEIKTDIVISSHLNIDQSLKSQDKVISICKTLNASTYINPKGGVDLYDKKFFKQNGINLKFISSNEINYQQYNNFFPWLSIIDVLMFNDLPTVKGYLCNFSSK